MLVSQGNATRVETFEGKLVVEKVFVGKFQKEGSLTAQIRQKISRKAWYPSKQPNDSLQHNLFEANQFGYKENDYDSEETRVGFINVPVSQTAESIQAIIDRLYARSEAVATAMKNEDVDHPMDLSGTAKSALSQSFGITDFNQNFSKPCLQKILSNHPILSSQQINAIERGLRTMDAIAEAQAVRFSKGNALEGHLITDKNGKVQYKRIVFHKFTVEDEDRRNPDPNNVYMTPALSVELGNLILAGQPEMAEDSQGQQA